MKFDQLQYFVETARRQHVGQAARFLNISPSAISHSISALEEEFGKPLFEKRGRQIKLTPHGKLLLDRADFLLSEAERIREELSSEQLEMRGHYRVAATHALSAEFLAPAWFKLQMHHPALTATIQSFRSGEVVNRASTGEIDLGICFSPHASQSYEQELLHEGRLLLSFGKKHPFLKEKRIEDLSDYPTVAALSAQGVDNCESHPAYQKYRIRPRVVNLYDNYDVALKALRTGNAWALLPDFVANSHGDAVETYIPRGWDAVYKVAAVWPKNRIRTEALDYVIKGVADAIREVASASRR